MIVITNNQPRDLCAFYELPEKVRADFDYVGEDRYEPRFFRYRDAWYDAGDFVYISKGDQMRPFGHHAPAGSPLEAWDGIAADTFFSGVVIRYVDLDDMVVVGRCYT